MNARLNSVNQVISINNQHLNTNEKVHSLPNSIEVSRNSHLLKLYIHLGLFDGNLNFLLPQSLVNSPLPCLKKTQLTHLLNVLRKNVLLYQDNSYAEIPLLETLHEMLQNYPAIKDLEITGSEVYRILGWEWFEDYFSTIEHPSLMKYLSTQEFTRQTDVDLRLNVPNGERKAIEEMGYAFVKKLAKGNQIEKIKCHLFDNGLNRGFNVAFGGLNQHEIDLSIIAKLYRSYIFDHDCLTIRIERQGVIDLLKGNLTTPHIKVIGQVHGGWSAPLLWLAKLLHTDPRGTNLAAISTLFSHYTKGAEIPLDSLEKSLTETMFNTLRDIRGQKDALRALQGALKNHLPNCHEAQVAFTLNLFSLLHSYKKAHLVDASLLDSFLISIKQPTNLLSAIGRILKNNLDLYPLIMAYLLVNAHMMNNRQKSFSQGGRLSISYFSDRKDIFKLKINQKEINLYILLPMDLEEAYALIGKNIDKIKLIKELEGFFYEQIHLCSSFSIGTQEPLGAHCTFIEELLKKSETKLLGYSLLESSLKGNSISNHFVLAFIDILANEKNSHLLNAAINYFLYYSIKQAFTMADLLPVDSLEIIKLASQEVSLMQKIFITVNFLTQSKNANLLSPLYQVWKSFVSPVQSDNESKITIGLQIFENTLMFNLNQAADILKDLFALPNLTTELARDSFLKISKNFLAKHDYEKGSLIRLKNLFISLGERVQTHPLLDPDRDAKFYLRLLACLSDCFPLDAFIFLVYLDKYFLKEINKDPLLMDDLVSPLINKVLSLPSNLVDKKSVSYLLAKKYLESFLIKSPQFLNQRGILTWFSPKESSILWGQTILNKISLCEDENLQEILTAITYFEAYSEKLVFAPALEETCIYQLGGILIQLLNGSLPFHQKFIEFFINKYGPSGCSEVIMTAKRMATLKDSKSILQNRKLAKGLAGRKRNNFYKLMEGLLDSLLTCPTSSHEKYFGIALDFNVYLHITSHYYREKSAKMFDWLYAFLFKPLPKSLLVSHLEVSLTLYKELGQVLSYDSFDKQKRWELEFFLTNNVDKLLNYPKEIIIKGMDFVSDRLFYFNIISSHVNFFQILNQIPLQVFYENQLDFQKLHIEYLQKLKEVAVNPVHALIIGHFDPRGLNQKDSQYKELNQAIIESRLDYLIWLFENSEELAPFHLFKLAVSYFLKATSFPDVKADTAFIFKLLDALTFFAAKMASTGKKSTLLSIFHYLKGLYQKDEAATDLLANAYMGWIERLASLPDNKGDESAEEGLASPLYDEFWHYLENKL